MRHVSDDSGFLALIDPNAYRAFVASDWTIEMLQSHFLAEMASRTLLIWGTGLEGLWSVDIIFERATVSGFRHDVTRGSLLLTNYESLTMAAQFSDVTLPERHQEHLLLSLPSRSYSCRIIQMFDPVRQEQAAETLPDFVIEIVGEEKPLPSWRAIPWFDSM